MREKQKGQVAQFLETIMYCSKAGADKLNHPIFAQIIGN